MAKKAKVSAIEEYAKAQAVYLQWVDAVVNECELDSTNGALLRNVLLGKPPAVWIVDQYIQTRFSLTLEQKQTILAQMKETDDKEKLQSLFEQIRAIEKNEQNAIWHP